jgi:hypothetical protein
MEVWTIQLWFSRSLLGNMPDDKRDALRQRKVIAPK